MAKLPDVRKDFKDNNLPAKCQNLFAVVVRKEITPGYFDYALQYWTEEQIAAKVIPALGSKPRAQYVETLAHGKSE